MTYALDLTTLTVVQTTIGLTTAVFTITQVPTDPNLNRIIVKYRVKGTGPWSEASLTVPIAVNSTITLLGLTEETEYEAYAIAEDTTIDLSDVDAVFEFKTLSSSLPAAEPVQERILQDLVTTIQGITQGTDYFNTMQGVKRDTGGPFEIAHADKPCAFVAGFKTDEHDNIVGSQTVHLFAVIEVYFQSPDDNFDTNAQYLIHDVKKAILIDEKRGGNAIDTRVEATEVFHSELSAPEGVIIVIAKIHFRHGTRDPSVVGKC